MIHAFYSTSYNASNRAKSWNKKLIFWKIKMAFLGNRPQIWSIMTRIWGSNILTTYRLRLYTRYYQEVHQVACTIMSRLHYYKFLLALISHGQVQNLPIWVHPKLTWVKGQTDYLPFDWWAGFVVWDHDVIFAFYGSMLGLWDGFSKWCWLEGALVQSEIRIFRWIRFYQLKTCLSSWNKNIRTLFIASLTPLISSIYCFRSRSRYSNTKVKQLCVWIISWSVTIFACFNPRSNDTKIFSYQFVTILSRDEAEMADLKIADVQNGRWKATIFYGP